MSPVLIRALLFTVLLATLAGCTRTVSNSAPPRLSETLAPETRTSVITVPIAVSLAEVEDVLNQKVPPQLYALDEDREDCTPDIEECLVPRLVHDGSTCVLSIAGHCRLKVPRLRESGCVTGQLKIIDGLDCHLKGAVTRGRILVSGQQRTLRIVAPIEASVTASDLGGIGRGVHSTANGSIEVSANLSFDVDENWNPSATFEPTYRWDERFGVDIVGTRVTLGSKVEPELNKAIEKIKAELPKHLLQLNLKTKATQIWERAFAPVRIHDNPDIWLRMTPEQLGYSGYTIEGGILRFSAMLTARTETFVGSEPTPAPPSPLPRLQRELPVPGFHFVLPVVANFDAMEKALAAALKFGQEQRFQVPGYGAVDVTIHSVDIYQTTDQRLAVGLDLQAKPEKWFGRMAGKVWVSTGLKIDEQGQLISSKDLQIVSDTDNAAFDVAVAVLNLPAIKQTLIGSVQYDFSAEYARLIDAVNQRLRMPLAEGIQFTGQIINASVREVAADDAALRMVAEIDGMAEITSDPAASLVASLRTKLTPNPHP